MRIVVEGDVTPKKLAEAARHMAEYLDEHQVQKMQRITIDVTLGAQPDLHQGHRVTPHDLRQYLDERQTGLRFRSAELSKSKVQHLTPAMLGLLAVLGGVIFLGFLGKIGFF